MQQGLFMQFKMELTMSVSIQLEELWKTGIMRVLVLYGRELLSRWLSNGTERIKCAI